MFTVTQTVHMVGNLNVTVRYKKKYNYMWT